MSREENLMVYDEEYEAAAKYLREYCDSLLQLIDSYENIVNVILNNAIKDEKISKTIRDRVEKIKTAKTEITEVRDTVPGMCTLFVSNIDVTDDFLY